MRDKGATVISKHPWESRFDVLKGLLYFIFCGLKIRWGTKQIYFTNSVEIQKGCGLPLFLDAIARYTQKKQR